MNYMTTKHPAVSKSGSLDLRVKESVGKSGFLDRFGKEMMSIQNSLNLTEIHNPLLVFDAQVGPEILSHLTLQVKRWDFYNWNPESKTGTWLGDYSCEKSETNK